MLCPPESVEMTIGDRLRSLSHVLCDFESKYGERLFSEAGEGVRERLCRLAVLLAERMRGDWASLPGRVVGFGVFNLSDMVKMSRRVFREGADGVCAYLCEPADGEASYIIVAPCCCFKPLEGADADVVAASLVSPNVRRLFSCSPIIMLR